MSNIDIMTFETSCNVATNTRAWNKRTQGWLERYVYMRTGTIPGRDRELAAAAFPCS